jgi:hypothetical protein
MLQWAKALIGALLIVSVGFCGGIGTAVVRASWNDLLHLAVKNGAMDAFHHLSELFHGPARH